MSAEDKQPTQVLQDGQPYPTVSFDVGLGKQVNYIDFDYKSYTDTLQKSGLSPAQISDTTIQVLPRRARMVDAGAEENKPIEVRLSKNINDVLAHETAHYTDFTHNPRTKTEKTRTALTNLARKLSIPFMAGGAVGEIATDQLELGKIADLGSIALVGVGVLMFGGALVSYATDPREKHAFAVQKAETNQYFTVQHR